MARRASIRITIFINFLLLILLTSGLLISVQYYFSEKLVLSAADEKFKSINDAIYTQYKDLADESEVLLELLGVNPNILDPVSHDKTSEAQTLFIKALEKNPRAYALYIGDGNGDFYEIINLHSDNQVYKKLKAPETARWVVLTVSNEDQYQTKRFRYLDAHLNTISKRSEITNYKAYTRPWYRHAMASDGVYKSEPYFFSNLNAPGITFSKRIPGSSKVIAIDFTSNFLNHYLINEKPTPDSQLLVFNNFGQILFDSHDLDIQKKRYTSVKKIDLTTEEQLWIEANPKLRLSNQLNWPPFDFREKGMATGYSVDMLKLIEAKTGLKFKFLNGYKWSEILEEFKAGNLDVVHTINPSEARKKYGDFTQPFLDLKRYFITHIDAPEIFSFDDLTHKRIATVDGWMLEKFLRKNYPDIEIKAYPDTISAYKAVESGQADVMIDNNKTFRYLKNKYDLSTLKLNHVIPADHHLHSEILMIMVQKNQPELMSIFNKAIASISDEEKSFLNVKWGIEDSALQQSETSTGTDIPPQLLSLLKAGEYSVTTQIDINGIANLVSMQPLIDFNNSQAYLSIMIPVKTIRKPFDDIMLYSVFSALLVLFIVMPLTYFNTGQLVKPIRRLMEMNHHIKNQRYEKVRPIDSHITELHDLSKSFIQMSNSIQTYEKSQEELLDSIIHLIAEAIDAKSPYTGGHCKRVPELALMLVDAANQDREGLFKDFSLTDKHELKAFKIGAWLHDCGKVTTPEYVVDKSTKLETIYNRIHEIRMRFEVLWRDAEIEFYQSQLKSENADETKELEENLHNKHKQLIDDFNFIAKANIGGEFMSSEDQSRIREIAEQTWTRHFDDRLGLSQIELERYSDDVCVLPVKEKLLDDKAEHIIIRQGFDHEEYRQSGFKMPVPEHLNNMGEVYNLCITKGTLNEEERFKINEHVIMTIKMLNKIPLPDYYQNIPEYAGTHHEKVDGTGYPCNLKGEELSVPAKMMVIADIFEALTASDRPYKQPKTLSEAVKILSFMRDEQHIDSEVFEFFLKSGVYRDYAKRYLKPEQIDDVELETYL